MCQMVLESIHFKGFYEAMYSGAFFKAHLIYIYIFNVSSRQSITLQCSCSILTNITHSGQGQGALNITGY